MNHYEDLMKKCIELAKQGLGNVSPNPLVGCVVLDKNSNIISTGYHHKYGDNHAERDALLKLKNGEEEGGTLIVNLEPCSHYGKTPPCVDLIIERKLKRVVIGNFDSNPKVAGRGIKKLKDAGIEVITGVLEKECKKLNEVFFYNMEHNKCFIALKTATTIDGKIATISGDSKWITSNTAREKGRSLRGYYDAILTSSATILADNPNMEHKLKIVLDKDFKTDFTQNIYKSGNVLLVTKLIPENIPDNVEIISPNIVDNKIDLISLSETLYQKGIRSIFIEAGSKLSGEFVRLGLVNKIYHFIAPKILNDNSGKSCFDSLKRDKISDADIFKTESVDIIGDDILIVYTNAKE